MTQGLSDQGSAGTKAGEENQHRFVNAILVRTTGDPAPMMAALGPAAVGTGHDELISGLTAVFSVLALLLASIGQRSRLARLLVSRIPSEQGGSDVWIANRMGG